METYFYSFYRFITHFSFSDSLDASRQPPVEQVLTRYLAGCDEKPQQRDIVMGNGGPNNCHESND